MIGSVRSKIVSLFADRGFAEILSGSIYALSARVVTTGLALLSSILVARLYGAEIIGIVAATDSVLMMTTVFTVLGTSTSVLRLIPEHMTRYSVTSAFSVYRKTQCLVIVISLLAGSALFASSGFVAAKIFGKPHLSFLFALAAPFVVVKSLMILNTEAVRGLRLAKAFACLQMLPVASMLVFLVGGTLLLDDKRVPVYAHLAGAAVTALTGLWVVDSTFKGRMGPGDVVHSMRLKEIVAVSAPMLMSAAMFFVIGQTGVLMLSIFRTDAEVGYYSVAVRLASLSAFLLVAINSMAAPKFSELFQSGQMDELLRVARKATRLMFWTSSPVLLGLIVLGRPVLPLLFGTQFTGAYTAMLILALGQFVNSVSGSTGIFLNMTGHQKVFQGIMLAAAGLNVVLNLALIPRFGIEGAAVAAVTAMVFWNVGALLYIRSKFGSTIGYFPLFRLPAAGGR